MPGGRLTHDDRRQIGAGLTDGLGYAEIARILDRPTSTISREVARNGGPRGYRPDHAHHATAYRARRRATSVVDADGNHEAEFAERFAQVMTENGLPRMAARVLARLYTTDSHSLTAAELVRMLRVSPASISKAIGYLEDLEVVSRHREPRARHENYFIAEDVWLRAWQASARTNAAWARLATEGAELFGTDTPIGARLLQMAGFFTQLSDDMSGGPTGPAADNAATILAALIHADRPLTANQLATALDWRGDRVATALQDAETYSAYTDPIALHRPTPTTYTVTATPTRLTPTQRHLLRPTIKSGFLDASR